MTSTVRRRAAGTSRHPRLAALALVVVAVLLVAACGATSPSSAPAASAGPTSTPSAAQTAVPTTGPSATPMSSADLTALFRQIEDQVVAERGLQAKQRLDPTILSETELKSRIADQFRKDNPPDTIAASEGTLKALGLLPADASLEKLYIDLLGSQVAGYYDPKAKQLFVVSRSGQVGATEKTTFAHEFTHALQDQNFGLQGIDVDAVGQGDRSLARLALVEGDATLLMTRWLTQHLAPADLTELLKVDPASTAMLATMPAILRETLLFPYQQGLAFVSGLAANGGWPAVDRVYGRLPDSTEQILHPEKYVAGEKPVAVPLDGAALAKSMGAGWSSTPTDTLGEFQLSIWLRENGVPALDAQAAAAGWGGDRIEYLRGPNGAYALALLTRWDTPKDASEFAAAATIAAKKLPGAADVVEIPNGGPIAAPLNPTWAVLAASDAATLAKLRAVVAPPIR